MTHQQLAAHVDTLVASWPALTDETLERIATLLRSGQPTGKRGSKTRARVA
jgi:hypothetical protein